MLFGSSSSNISTPFSASAASTASSMSAAPPQKFSLKNIFNSNTNNNNNNNNHLGNNLNTTGNNNNASFNLQSNAAAAAQTNNIAQNTQVPRGSFTDVMRTITEQTQNQPSFLPYSSHIKHLSETQSRTNFLPALNQRLNSKSTLSYQTSVGELLPVSRVRPQQQTPSKPQKQQQAQQQLPPKRKNSDNEQEHQMKEALKDWLIGKTDINPDTITSTNFMNSKPSESSPFSGGSGSGSTACHSPISSVMNSNTSKRRFVRPSRISHEFDMLAQQQDSNEANTSILAQQQQPTQQRDSSTLRRLSLLSGSGNNSESNSMQHIPIPSLPTIPTSMSTTSLRKSMRNNSELLPHMSSLTSIAAPSSLTGTRISGAVQEALTSYFRPVGELLDSRTNAIQSTVTPAATTTLNATTAITTPTTQPVIAPRGGRILVRSQKPSQIQESLNNGAINAAADDDTSQQFEQSSTRVSFPRGYSQANAGFFGENYAVSTTYAAAAAAAAAAGTTAKPQNNSNDDTLTTTMTQTKFNIIRNSRRNLTETPKGTSDSFNSGVTTSPKGILKPSSSLPRRQFLSPASNRKVIFNDRVKQYVI